MTDQAEPDFNTCDISTSQEQLVELERLIDKSTGVNWGRFALQFAGPLGAGASAAWAEYDQGIINRVIHILLGMHKRDIESIGITLIEIVAQIEAMDDKMEKERIRARMNSAEYQSIVQHAIRNWQGSSSEKKRILFRQLLSNAARSSVTEDKIVKLFIDWIAKFDELHISVISSVYNHAGITRRGMWLAIHDEIPAENSAQADLFKLLIHDLSIGHVIRQHRPVDFRNNFVKVKKSKKSAGPGGYKSAFDSQEPYELTEIGKQFVHYAMTDSVIQIDSQSSTPKEGNNERHIS